MTLDPNELYYSTNQGAALRCQACEIQPKTFSVGTALIAALTPVAKNRATGWYEIWQGRTTEVNTLTGQGTRTSGTWKIIVDGETTATIALTATAANIKDALVALGGINPDDLTVTGGPINTTPVVITWAGKEGQKAKVVTTDSSGIVGGGTIDSVDTVPGVGDNVSGDFDIAGFIWPDAVQLLAGNQVIGNVLMKGLIHFDDIPIVSGYTSTQLKEALRNGGVREKGFTIQGLTGI